jgi:hypothetical protein
VYPDTSAMSCRRLRDETDPMIKDDSTRFVTLRPCFRLASLAGRTQLMVWDGLTVSDHPSGIVHLLGRLRVLQDENRAVTNDRLARLGRVNPAESPSVSVTPIRRKTYTSEDPVSRSTSRYCGGVPYPTRLRYSRSPLMLAAPTSPTVPSVSSTS